LRLSALILAVVGLVCAVPVSGRNLPAGFGVGWDLPVRELRDHAGATINAAILFDKDCPTNGCKPGTQYDPKNRPHGGPRLHYVTRSSAGTWSTLKTWPAFYGRNEGPKVRQGDKKTPEGLYLMLHASARSSSDKDEWRRFGSAFFELDHPSNEDRNAVLGKPYTAGGEIGIHGGYPRPTLGCIRLIKARRALEWNEYDDAIRELYALFQHRQTPGKHAVKPKIPVLIAPRIHDDCMPGPGETLSADCGQVLDTLMRGASKYVRPARQQVIRALASPPGAVAQLDTTPKIPETPLSNTSDPDEQPGNTSPPPPPPPPPPPVTPPLVIGGSTAVASSVLQADSEQVVGCLDPRIVDPENGGQIFIDCDADRLLDGRTDTAWCEGATGNGECATVDLTLEGAPPIWGIRLRNGYGKTGTTFKENGRPMRIRVLVAGETLEYALDTSSPKPQDLLLPQAVQVEALRLQISDVRTGEKYEDTCMTELEFLTRQTPGAKRPVKRWQGTGPVCAAEEPVKPQEKEEEEEEEETGTQGKFEPKQPPTPPSVFFSASSTLLNACVVNGHKGACRARYLADKNNSTAWCEDDGRNGTGSGEWVELTLSEPAVVDSLVVVPGYAKSQQVYQDNGRPAALRVQVDGRPAFTVQINPGYGVPTTIHIPSSEPLSTVRLTMTQVTPGTRWRDTCISGVTPVFASPP